MGQTFSAAMLPDDLDDAVLVGRLLLEAGPTPVVIRSGQVFDVSRAAPTVADLLDRDDAASIAGELICSTAELIERAGASDHPLLLSPVDLQVVKAAGVTVGRVEQITINDGIAEVTMTIEEENVLPDNLGAEIRYRNLVGQRMITGVAKKMAGQFFSAVDKELSAPNVVAEVVALPIAQDGSAEPSVTRGPDWSIGSAPAPTAGGWVPAEAKPLLVGAAAGGLLTLLGVWIGHLLGRRG